MSWHSFPIMHPQTWLQALPAGLGDILQSTVVVYKPEGLVISRRSIPQEEPRGAGRRDKPGLEKQTGRQGSGCL